MRTVFVASVHMSAPIRRHPQPNFKSDCMRQRIGQSVRMSKIRVVYVLYTPPSVLSPYCLRHDPYSIRGVRTFSADGEEYVDSTERVRKYVRRQYGGGVDSTDAGGDSTDAGGDSADAGGDSAEAA